MATVSISHMFLFIAGLMVTASVVGVLTQEVDRVSSAIDQQGLDVSKQIRSDVEIISDAGSSVCDGCTSGGSVTLLVKNTGSRGLTAEPDLIDVLINGTYVGDSKLAVTVEDGSAWEVGNVANVTITDLNLAGATDHRVKIIVRGDEEVFEFRT